MAQPSTTRVAVTSNINIQVIDHDSMALQAGQQPVAVRCRNFAVKREVLIKSSGYFRAMLNPKYGFKEEKTKTIVLKEDNAVAMEIWLRILHNTLVQASYNAEASTVRTLFIIADKYQFAPSLLRGWFQVWFPRWTQIHQDYRTHLREYKNMVWFCLFFDNAWAFALVTRVLVYYTIGPVTVIVPDTDGLELSIPDAIILRLNNVKRRLVTVLDRQLSGTVDSRLYVGCGQPRHTWAACTEALREAGVLPLYKTDTTRCMRDVLDRLDEFYLAEMDTCSGCRAKYHDYVHQDGLWVWMYFDGLCLNCMDVDALKYNIENFEHRFEANSYDAGCRIVHGHASWYYSYPYSEASRRQLLERRYRHYQAQREGFAASALDRMVGNIALQ
ncbi:MAG: hypothetical protein Q9208_002439 [Pyrenodesmia sp. 3 TL-2023]